MEGNDKPRTSTTLRLALALMRVESSGAVM